MRRASSFIAQSLATESIDFQPTTFFKELVLAITDLKQAKKTEITDSEVIPRIIGIVKHHTGLNIAIDIGDHHPSVTCPAVNKNNPLINSFIRNFVSSADGLKMIAAAGGVCRGTVSLKNSKVTGIFAEIQSTVRLPVYFFTGEKFTAEEVAAVFLHELGHLFTYYEFITRTVTTNQVLAGMSKALDGSGTIEEREAVLINAKKALNLSELDVKALAKANNTRIAEIVVVTNITKEAESELDSNIYDFSTWEALADQFAARHGAGRHNVTALAKYYKGDWNISFRSLPAYLAMEAFKLITLLVLPVISITLFSIDGSGDGTYDRPGARMKRTRNQVVENLKDKDLSKDDHDRLMADIAAIDEVLQQVEDRRQFIEVIWNAVVPYSRKAWNQERLQRELEDIAANDIFIKSAELRQLA